MNKFIIFGAGGLGEEALRFFGYDNVLCFIDNDRNKFGDKIEGKVINYGEEC